MIDKYLNMVDTVDLDEYKKNRLYHGERTDDRNHTFSKKFQLSSVPFFPLTISSLYFPSTVPSNLLLVFLLTRAGHRLFSMVPALS